jgi:hypothetical protein
VLICFSFPSHIAVAKVQSCACLRSLEREREKEIKKKLKKERKEK